ncbi:hypothetical protein ACHAWX_001825 [Stephanocyclus meneghinianus]
MDVESEFAYLKQQNRFLEQKLDILLKITLNPGGVDGFRSGEKRRRFDVPDAYSHHMDYTHPSSHHYDECKYSENDSPFSSHTYRENKFSEDQRYHSSEYEPLPYRPSGDTQSYGTKKPCQKKPGSEYHSADQRKNGNLSEFIDVMLTDDDEECHVLDYKKSDQGYIREEPGLKTSASKLVEDVSSHDEFKHDTGSFHRNDLEDETLNEALGTILTQNLNEDPYLFSSSFDMNEGLPMNSHQIACNVDASGFLTMSNRAMDKSSGPEPVFSSDVAVENIRDIEEGNLPVGVAVISAEFVPNEHTLINEADHQALQQELDRERLKKKKRHRVIYVLSFLLVAMVCVFVAWPLVVIKKNTEMEKAEYHAEMSSEDNENVRHQTELFDDPQINETIAEHESLGQDNELVKDQQLSSQTRSGSMPAVSHNESLFAQDSSSPSSLSLTIAGTEFSCSRSAPRY